MLLTSLQNPRVKAVVALRDRRERDRSGVMRVEGFEELSLALASGARLRALFYCPQLFATPDQIDLVERIAAMGVDVYEATVEVFGKMAYREGPDGWLAVCDTLATRLDDISLSTVPFLIVAEAVEKPGNLGAMLRTADAVGVDAVLAAAPITDWGNPNIVRASKGAVFSVPVAAASTMETLDWLRERGIAIVAATPAATALYTDVDLRGPIAIAVGAEKHGLSDSFLAAADIQVRIPMWGRVNSLNVSIATALLAYEALRQRKAHDALTRHNRGMTP